MEIKLQKAIKKFLFYKEICTTSQKKVFKGSELDLTKLFLSDRQGRTLEEAVYQFTLQFVQWFLGFFDVSQ